MTPQDKYLAVKQDHKNKEGSIKSLCKKHGISTPTYYEYRKKFGSKKSQTKTIKLKKKQPKFIDVPVISKPNDFVIICKPESLAKVLGTL